MVSAMPADGMASRRYAVKARHESDMETGTFDKSRISLLYVEDDPNIRKMIGIIITEKHPDITLHSAENGQQGVELFKKHRPDLVLADIRMPVMDGIRMAREIRALKPRVEIIFITANSDTQSLLEAIKLGVSSYLLKPIDHKQLLEAIDDSIDRVDQECRNRKQHEYIRKLSRAIEQSPSVVIITDDKGAIEYVNPKFTDLTGYTPAEAIGRNPRILKTDATPPERFIQLWSTIRSGQQWCGEFVNRKKNGDLYHEAACISPLVNEEGTITHYIGVKENITERKRHEEEIRILNIGLAQRAAELEALNRDLDLFSAAVSHDLRTPLTGINASCQVLMELYGDRLDDQGRQFLGYINQETLRMDKMIDTLLNFSHLTKQGFRKREIDLTAIARKVAKELQLGDPHRQVDFRIQEHVAGVGDYDLLHVVLANLMGNAWKYTRGKDAPLVEFGVTDSDGKTAYFVRDNGVGFDAKNAVRIFEEFQRLHGEDEFEGHGIGLAMAQRIIQRHGGKIWAEGEIGEGATFYFTL
jgi:PAS domain S-box-containing protein